MILWSDDQSEDAVVVHVKRINENGATEKGYGWILVPGPSLPIAS